jgi:hypothetical protein
MRDIGAMRSLIEGALPSGFHLFWQHPAQGPDPQFRRANRDIGALRRHKKSTIGSVAPEKLTFCPQNWRKTGAK